MPVTYTDFAVTLLNDVLGTHNKEVEHDVRNEVRLESLGFLVPDNGEEIHTTGCPSAPGAAEPGSSPLHLAHSVKVL